MKYLDVSQYRYNLGNCLFIATYDQVLKQCKCIPDFHQVSYKRCFINNTTVLHHQEGMCGVRADYPSLPTCTASSLYCMNEIFRKIGSYKTIHETGQVCMPACEDQVYNMEVTSSTFPNRATFPKRDEQCLLIMKLRVRSLLINSAFSTLFYR